MTTDPRQSEICPICSGAADELADAFPTAIVGCTTTVLRCRRCTTTWSTAEVPDGLYEAIYESEQPVSFYDRYYRYARSVERRRRPLRYLAYQEDVYFAVSKVLHNRAGELYSGRSMRIAEVGSGLGYLTAALCAEGFDCVGMDISNAAVERARARFGPRYRRVDITDPPKDDLGAYDIVILLEVIEHVPNPVQFLDSMCALLSSNGAVVMSTPDSGIYPTDVVWKSDLPPVHLYWFNHLSIATLARRCSMSAEFVSFLEFNRRRYQSVPVDGPIAEDVPYLTDKLVAAGNGPRVHRLMEFLQQVPALADTARCLATLGRGHRRLRNESFSLAAVLTPLDKLE